MLFLFPAIAGYILKAPLGRATALASNAEADRGGGTVAGAWLLKRGAIDRLKTGHE
jgi:hypothetical protein